MSSTSFSLTQCCIINPILYMRAELRGSSNFGKKVYHCIEAQVFARIIAISTSVFAAMDAFVHFSTGCYKGLLLGKSNCTWNKAEVSRHFRRAAFFSMVALAGTVTAIIWPGIVKSFKQSTPNPFKQNVDINAQLPKEISGLIQKINCQFASWNPADSKLLIADLDDAVSQVQPLWRRYSLSAKHWFVMACNQDDQPGSKLYSKIRKVMASTVYRPIDPSQKVIYWFNRSELEENAKHTANIEVGSYYHATSETALQSILKGRKVEVRHEKAYRGAFVSTEPELSFGKCVLVFNRNIERLSQLEHGFTINRSTYWAGFSQDIPVNASTLAYIALNTHDESERKALEDKCTQWAGRTITVVPINYAERELQSLQGAVGIPEEWPEEGQAAGLAIFNAMKLAIPAQKLTVSATRVQQQQQMLQPTSWRALAIPPPAKQQQRMQQPVGGRALLLAN